MSSTSQIGKSSNDERNNSVFNGSEEGGEKVSSEGEIKVTDIRSKPLYNGSHITLETTLLIVCLFMIKHNFTQTAMDDFLSVLTYLLPVGNIMARTFTEFKHLFSKLKYPIVLHYYCSFCLMPIEDKKLTTCPNMHCQHNLTIRNGKSYFIKIPIIEQLQAFLNRPCFYDHLQHRFKRKCNGTLRDVYDGRLYKNLERCGILSSGDNISFMFNTDGAPVFKSSKMSLWPIYLVINELPISCRFNKENMIAGLWFGDKKPFMLNFLKPTVAALERLESGVEMCYKDKGNFTMKAVMLACVCDLPARALLMNFMQYNGAYSCPYCLQPGKSADSGKGHTHVFQYQSDCPKGPERVDVSSALEAHEHLVNNGKENPVNGVKGISLLMGLKYFDTVEGVGVDYMHGILLGVQKHLLTLWLSPQHSKDKFSVFDKLDAVEECILQLKPPSDIKRAPRSIQDTLKYWKSL